MDFDRTFVIQTITNFILCNYYLLPQEVMYGKVSLQNTIPQKVVVSEE